MVEQELRLLHLPQLLLPQMPKAVLAKVAKAAKKELRLLHLPQLLLLLLAKAAKVAKVKAESFSFN
jgi:hypothetical protein